MSLGGYSNNAGAGQEERGRSKNRVEAESVQRISIEVREYVYARQNCGEDQKPRFPLLVCLMHKCAITHNLLG